MRQLPFLLWALAVTHMLVDTVASCIQPLWPELRRDFELNDQQLQIAFLCFQAANSMSQVGFAWLCDRFRLSWIMWLGPALATACMFTIGWANSLGQLCLLLLFGGLGIAAFHPEATALAGSCAPEQRSRAVSIFAIGGFLGMIGGPLLGGGIASHSGIAGMAWCVPGTLVVLATLFGLMTWKSPPTSPLPHHPVPLAHIFDGKRRAAALVLTIGALRVVPTVGIPLAIAFTLDAQHASPQEISYPQAFFQTGMGIGVLVSAMIVRRTAEQRTLVFVPLAVVPIVMLFAMQPSQNVMRIFAGLCGLAYGCTHPLLISYGQRLLPKGQRIASSITMGASWGIGGAIIAGLMYTVNKIERPELAFYFLAIASITSSMLCLKLPEVEGHQPVPRIALEPATQGE